MWLKTRWTDYFLLLFWTDVKWKSRLSRPEEADTLYVKVLGFPLAIKG